MRSWWGRVKPTLIGLREHSGVKRQLPKVSPRLTEVLYPLPDYLIIGTQKGGTNFLHHRLASHSQIAPADCKEIHFFDFHFRQGVPWYRSYFPSRLRMAVLGQVVTGEASPYYLYHPHVPQRIAETVPNVKLIILLRDPVDRAISHYWHEVNYTEAEDLPMEEAFQREDERLAGEKEKLAADDEYCSFEHRHYSYLDRGNYVDQIERYRRFFDDDQMLLLKSETLFQETQSAFRTVTDFLGVKAEPLPEEALNTGTYSRDTEPTVREWLERYYRDQKQTLAEKYGICFQ